VRGDLIKVTQNINAAVCLLKTVTSLRDVAHVCHCQSHSISL